MYNNVAQISQIFAHGALNCCWKVWLGWIVTYTLHTSCEEAHAGLKFLPWKWSEVLNEMGFCIFHCSMYTFHCSRFHSFYHGATSGMMDFSFCLILLI